MERAYMKLLGLVAFAAIANFLLVCGGQSQAQAATPSWAGTTCTKQFQGEFIDVLGVKVYHEQSGTFALIAGVKTWEQASYDIYRSDLVDGVWNSPALVTSISPEGNVTQEKDVAIVGDTVYVSIGSDITRCIWRNGSEARNCNVQPGTENQNGGPINNYDNYIYHGYTFERFVMGDGPWTNENVNINVEYYYAVHGTYVGWDFAVLALDCVDPLNCPANKNKSQLYVFDKVSGTTFDIVPGGNVSEINPHTFQRASFIDSEGVIWFAAGDDTTYWGANYIYACPPTTDGYCLGTLDSREDCCQVESCQGQGCATYDCGITPDGDTDTPAEQDIDPEPEDPPDGDSEFVDGDTDQPDQDTSDSDPETVEVEESESECVVPDYVEVVTPQYCVPSDCSGNTFMVSNTTGETCHLKIGTSCKADLFISDIPDTAGGIIGCTDEKTCVNISGHVRDVDNGCHVVILPGWEEGVVDSGVVGTTYDTYRYSTQSGHEIFETTCESGYVWYDFKDYTPELSLDLGPDCQTNCPTCDCKLQAAVDLTDKEEYQPPSDGDQTEQETTEADAEPEAEMETDEGEPNPDGDRFEEDTPLDGDFAEPDRSEPDPDLDPPQPPDGDAPDPTDGDQSLTDGDQTREEEDSAARHGGGGGCNGTSQPSSILLLAGLIFLLLRTRKELPRVS